MTSVDVDVPAAAVPGQHGVYVAFDGVGEVLYIGRTQNLVARMGQHRYQSAWFRQMRTLEFTPCDGPNESRVLEKSMIRTFRPDANTNDRLPQQTSAKQTLPAWTVAKLVTLYEASVAARGSECENDRLNCYILAIRQSGWTLGAIGEGLTLTREAVRQRAARAPRADYSFGVPPAPVKPKPVKKPKPTIPPVVLHELLALKPDAMRVKGPTPLDSPLRQASERYTEIIAEQHLAGVSISRIAQQLGVTHLAIRARLARHGYMEEVKGLPGNTRYGTPWITRREKCRAGHDFAGENVRFINGDTKRRVCRACENRRSAEYHARKKESA